MNDLKNHVIMTKKWQTTHRPHTIKWYRKEEIKDTNILKIAITPALSDNWSWKPNWGRGNLFIPGLVIIFISHPNIN